MLEQGMSRTVDKALFTPRRLKNGEKSFIANEAGISDHKTEITLKAEHTVLLQKGEDFGVFINMLLNLMSQPPEVIHRVFQMYIQTFPEVSHLDAKMLANFKWTELLAFYTLMTKGAEIIMTKGEQIKRILTRGRKATPVRDLRILCNSYPLNEDARPGWEEMGYAVRHYECPSQAGSHRYYLTDKTYSFFIRRPDSTFFGFHGCDPTIMADLRSQFEAEWNTSVPPRQVEAPVLSGRDSLKAH